MAIKFYSENHITLAPNLNGSGNPPSFPVVLPRACHLGFWLTMCSTYLTDSLIPPAPAVLHAPDGRQPSSPAGKRLIQCFRCGEQCRGEVLRVQSGHLHIKCFTCKGECYQQYVDVSVLRSHTPVRADREWWTALIEQTPHGQCWWIGLDCVMILFLTSALNTSLHLHYISALYFFLTTQLKMPNFFGQKSL